MSSSDTTNNINDILTKLNNKISCDSSCQRQKKIDDLKNKWMNAEQRGANSEEEIEQAKMNYYLYAGGENAYNEVKSSELQYEMNDSLDRYVYNTEHVQSLNELYNIKVKKNGEIENKIDEYNKITFTSQRKIVYENHDMNRIHTYHKIIIFIYYGLFLYYLVDGNFFADKLYKDRIMVSVFLFYLLFPFILKFVVRKLFDLANNISYAFNNKLHKNVYTNP